VNVIGNCCLALDIGSKLRTSEPRPTLKVPPFTGALLDADALGVAAGLVQAAVRIARSMPATTNPLAVVERSSFFFCTS
jgi:hypothetical protein